uniref:Translocase of inner mitochondrial membrane 29 n=1 Tax=Leptobrachium leishanense TaxID=445787 RepID=A0A8C5LW61_9ANUR
MAARSIRMLFRRSCSNAAPVSPPAGEVRKLGRWERLRTGRMGIWVKSLLHDYAEACKDIVTGAKERPGKAAFYISLLSGISVCSSKSPSLESFQCSFMEASESLLLLSPWTRSGKSDRHLQHLADLTNQGRLRYVNLMVFSLVYESPYDPDVALYAAQCSHLKPRWSEFPSRVLDVGFFGHWWLLRSNMEEFDMNEDEFAHLPEHMKTITFNDLHSEENERLFQEQYQPVVMPEEQEE